MSFAGPVARSEIGLPRLSDSVRLIASFPIDNVAKRPAIEIGTQIVAEDVDTAMTVLIASGRNVRRDQHPGIGPETRHRRVLEFADINVERGAAQMITLKRVRESLLVDDLAPGDVDEHASRLHRGKAILIEQAGCLRRPLAADHHEIAPRQEPIEILRPAELVESGWQWRARVRVAAGAEDPHTERGAKFTDVASDSAGAEDARGLAFR